MFAAVLALIFCIDRCNVALYSLAAVVIHEAGHLAAMLLCGSKPKSISLCACGVVIDADASMSLPRQLFIAAMGPTANLLPAAFIVNGTFRTAMLISGIFNLLPITGTDGGDLLYLLCEGIADNALSRLLRITVTAAFTAALMLFGTLVFFNSFNPTLIVAATYMLILFLSSFK